MISSINRMLLLACSLAPAWAVVARAELQPQPLTPEESQAWVRHLVPLPKQIQLKERLAVPAGRIAVVAPTNAEPLAGRAAAELRATLGPDEPGSPLFIVTLQLAKTNYASLPAGSEDKAEAEALAKLPHPDQAYLIRPAADGAGLRLVGGGPRGLYYAVKTLRQFLGERGKKGSFDVPLTSVTDWPDMERRGLWGSDSFDTLPWLSDRKMNFDEQIARNTVDAEKKPHVSLEGHKQRMVTEGPQSGIDPVPVILHLEQLGGSGIFEAFPELVAKGGREGTICYSTPRAAQVLTDWLLLWSKTPGVTGVDVWMAENLGGKNGCRCEGCKQEDRSVLEARTIQSAWREARKTAPELQLYALTSEETERSNPKVFKEYSPEVRIWYYHSLWTYNSSQAPMIRPYLEDAVKAGRWLGVCPNLCATVGFDQPFTGPQFVHYRVNEFVDKKLSGLMGYATPRVYLVAFNVEAAAEWSWNAKGRSPHEFAISWAVRQGLDSPERFAEWTDILGPVAWNIYGSEWPSGNKRKRPGKIADLLKAGKVPALGASLNDGGFRFPWGDIKTPEQLNRDVADADRAVVLARTLGSEPLVQESLVVQGYIQSLKALWELKQLANSGRVADTDKPAARRWFKQYGAGLAQANAALPAWASSVKQFGAGYEIESRNEILTQMIAEMEATSIALGCSQ